MKLLLKTLIIAFLLPLGAQELKAQDSKYSIDNGPVKEPLSRKIARWRYARDLKAKDRAAERIKEKQKKREEEGRNAMIKRHLANQHPKVRERLKKQKEEESTTYPKKEKEKKLPKKKVKKLEL